MHKCEDLHRDSVGGGARRLQEFEEQECKTLDTIRLSLGLRFRV